MKPFFVYRSVLLPAVLIAFLFVFNNCTQTKLKKALIVTGQNNSHSWEVGAEKLKTILMNSGIFEVELAVSPEKGADMSGFKPVFDGYDVVVLDYDGDPWPEETKGAFDSYVGKGGGLVVFHAANNSFADWKEFNLMTGFGGWGGRDEGAGPRLYWENGAMVKDDSTGKAGAHGKQHPYLVEIRNTEHPITKGMPESWMHAQDELYYNMRGPGENVEVLATAYDDTTYNGGGKDEIVMMTVSYGEGRIFHTTMGHIGKNADEYPAVECAGLITAIQRGAEWAATGEVTQAMPLDFPNSASVVQWPELRPLTLDELMEKVAAYKVGTSRIHISDLSGRIRQCDGSPEAYAAYEDKMLELLQSEQATDDSKKFVCRELSWMGSGKSVKILEKLTEDEMLSEMASYALQRISQ